jgi:hypothetical protein
MDVVQRLDPAPRSGKTLGDIPYFDHEKTKRRDCQRAWMRSRQAAAVAFIWDLIRDFTAASTFPLIINSDVFITQRN